MKSRNIIYIKENILLYINNWRNKMFLSNDEIIKVMLEYIEEDKYKSAILINGE